MLLRLLIDCLWIFHTHLFLLHFLSLAANGKYCLTAGHDRTVRLWNPARMDPAYPQQEQQKQQAGQDIPIKSLPRALPIHSYADGHSHPVSAIALDESSTTLISASDKTLVWTDVVAQSVQRRFHGHSGRINAVRISKNCEVCSYLE